jgi:hypothetical protein
MTGGSQPGSYVPEPNERNLMLIRQRWRRTAAVLAFLAFWGALGTTAAHADDAPESATEPTQAALLATPAELAELGFGAADIARQEAAVERLTLQESAAQARLRRAEARYSAGPAQHSITAPGRPALRLGGGVTPLTVGRDCTTSNKWYRLIWGQASSRLTYCVAGAGTWTINPYLPYVKSLRPGSQVGRTLYRPGADGELYWSLWRGPTQTEYYYNELYGSIRVYKIQISSGPTS